MKKSRESIARNSRTTIACMGLLVGMVFLYLYFLNMSVVQVVMRTEYIQDQRQLNAEIALLEAEYIEAQHTIAARIASLEGYDTNTDKIFVSRDQARLVLADE